MARRCSLALALTLASAFGFRPSFGFRISAFGFPPCVSHPDARALLELELPLQHHALAGAEALLNDYFPLVHLRRERGGDSHGAHFNGLIVLNDKDEVALRTALNDCRRHHGAALPDGQQQAGVDELARPEPQIRVGESRFEFELAAGGINLVVNYRKLPLGQDIGVTLVDGQNSEIGIPSPGTLAGWRPGLAREEARGPRWA